jgi:hypothetical protein
MLIIMAKYYSMMAVKAMTYRNKADIDRYQLPVMGYR